MSHEFFYWLKKPIKPKRVVPDGLSLWRFREFLWVLNAEDATVTQHLIAGKGHCCLQHFVWRW